MDILSGHEVLLFSFSIACGQSREIEKEGGARAGDVDLGASGTRSVAERRRRARRSRIRSPGRAGQYCRNQRAETGRRAAMRGRVAAIAPPLCAIASPRAMVVSRRSEAALSRTVASSHARVAAV